jgi:hypothetical protein
LSKYLNQGTIAKMFPESPWNQIRHPWVDSLACCFACAVRCYGEVSNSRCCMCLSEAELLVCRQCSVQICETCCSTKMDGFLPGETELHRCIACSPGEFDLPEQPDVLLTMLFQPMQISSESKQAVNRLVILLSLH